MQYVLLHASYSSENSVKFGVPRDSVLGLILVNLFINDLPLHVKNMSADCDQLENDTTLHTSEKIFYKSEAICKAAYVRYQTGVTVIIWSSIRSRPSL